jgi:hypothetical protein
MRSHRWSILPLSLTMVMTSACTAGAAFRGELTAAPSSVLELSWAKATRTKSGIVVCGQIRQVHCCDRAVPGHLHLEAKDWSGQTVASTDSNWGDFIARQLHSASFKALLPTQQGTSVSRVDVEFDVLGSRSQ